MKKRLVALIFLLVANLLLLAHAAIPHHLHLEQICFSSHCHSDCNDPEHHHPFPGQQEGDPEEDCCSVKQIAALPSLPGKQECKCAVGDIHPHLHLAVAIVFTDSELLPLLDERPLLCLPDLPDCWSGTFLLASGLRAPPVV